MTTHGLDWVMRRQMLALRFRQLACWFVGHRMGRRQAVDGECSRCYALPIDFTKAPYGPSPIMPRKAANYPKAPGVWTVNRSR